MLHLCGDAAGEIKTWQQPKFREPRPQWCAYHCNILQPCGSVNILITVFSCAYREWEIGSGEQNHLTDSNPFSGQIKKSQWQQLTAYCTLLAIQWIVLFVLNVALKRRTQYRRQLSTLSGVFWESARLSYPKWTCESSIRPAWLSQDRCTLHCPRRHSQKHIWF